MGADLSVDLKALEQAARTVQRVAGRLAELAVASATYDAVDALPATDTAAACAELARRLRAAVLAHADSLETTAGAVLGAARTYQATDADLAGRAAGPGGTAA
jgi:hypothetical protein